MKKTSKTIRISSYLIKLLEEKSEYESRSVSNLAETIFEDYFSLITRKEYCVDGEKFYPVHMDEKELYEVVNWVLSMGDFANHSEVEVRKHHEEKGVAFLINYHNLTNDNEIFGVRKHTFSIDSNWEILDFFDHWIKDFGGKTKYASEKINVVNESKEVIKKIKESIINRTPPKKNKIFKSDKWVKIYSNHEKYYLLE